MSLLQWGRARESAERMPLLADLGGLVSLQWGRARESAERAKKPYRRRTLRQASMGPRS